MEAKEAAQLANAGAKSAYHAWMESEEGGGACRETSKDSLGFGA